MSGGGGVGLFGLGASGTGGVPGDRTTNGGKAGSAGLGTPDSTNGADRLYSTVEGPGRFGGGGPGTGSSLARAGNGAVRIIWGSNRA